MEPTEKWTVEKGEPREGIFPTWKIMCGHEEIAIVQHHIGDTHIGYLNELKERADLIASAPERENELNELTHEMQTLLNVKDTEAESDRILRNHRDDLLDSKARLITTFKRMKQYFERTKIEGHEYCDMPCLGCMKEWICQDQIVRLVHGALKAEDK